MSRRSRIVLLVEGKTETAVKGVLKRFLDKRCEEEGKPKVRLDTREMDSRMLDKRKLSTFISNHLAQGDVRGVVALIDVRTSGRAPFRSAKEAIAFLRACGPKSDPRYRAHAAQYEFEAWLLPYWEDICKRLGVQRRSPGVDPERVNAQHPPSERLKALFRAAGRTYNKPVDAREILERQDLLASADRCPQLKAFLNSLIELADCRPLSSCRARGP